MRWYKEFPSIWVFQFTEFWIIYFLKLNSSLLSWNHWTLVMHFYHLCTCNGIPKLLYTSRSSPWFVSNLSLQYNDVVSDTMHYTFNVDLSAKIACWLQAMVPVLNGSLSVQLAYDLALTGIFVVCVWVSLSNQLAVTPKITWSSEAVLLCCTIWLVVVY